MCNFRVISPAAGWLAGIGKAATLRDATSGSACTARRLRTDPAVIDHSVRFNAYTDSFNSCILGADAAAGIPQFDLCHPRVAREVTVKAGQKCTAIAQGVPDPPGEIAVPGSGLWRGALGYSDHPSRWARVAAYDVLAMVSEQPVPDA